MGNPSPLELPIPTSGLTSSLSMGLNDDGDLDELIHLLGGCLSPYVPITIETDDEAQNEEGESEIETEENQENYTDDINDSDDSIVKSPHEYICPEISDFTFIFDPKNHTEEVRQGPSMPRPRHRHSSIAINGNIWVLGGRDEDGSVINEIDVYDSLQESWRTLDTGLDAIQVSPSDDMTTTKDYYINYGVSDQCVFELDGLIVMTGGFDNDYNALDHTIMIDSEISLKRNALVYAIKSPLNVPRGGCGAVGHADFALVGGGFTNEDGYCEAMKSVEVYDLKTDTWTQMESELRVGRAYFDMFFYEDNIVAFGGEQRGQLDQTTDRCMDQYQVMDGITWGMNMELPNRLTFPIDDDDGVEVWQLEDGQPNESVPWATAKASLTSNGKVRSSSFPYESLSKVFVFGGVWNDLDSILSTKLSKPCKNCYILSSDIEVFTNPLDGRKSPLSSNMVFLAFFSVSIMSFVTWMKRRNQHNNEKESDTGGATSANRTRSNGGDVDDDAAVETNNEQGMLIQANLWSDGAFSSDLDMEEMVWGEESFTDVELKEIA